MNGGRLLLVALASALVLAPPATAGDGIDLAAPANGSTWAAASALRFEWSTAWTGGVEAFLVATDPKFADLVAVHTWSCEPTCATGQSLAGLAPGTYFWGIGIKLDAGAVHLTEPWSFTISAPPKAGAPFAPPAHRKHRRKHRTR